MVDEFNSLLDNNEEKNNRLEDNPKKHPSDRSEKQKDGKYKIKSKRLKRQSERSHREIIKVQKEKGRENKAKAIFNGIMIRTCKR